MEQIIYELNGKKYLLVELLIKEGMDLSIEKEIKTFGCIYQGIKKINLGGFFDKAYGIIKLLVPEENVQEFNKKCFL